MVLLDAPCRTCGYNLRGLARAGECPECRTPVHRSLHGDTLCYSDPHWVRQLARGMNMLQIAVLLMIALGALLVSLPRVGMSPWLMSGLAIALGGVALVGVWLVTQPDPALIERDRRLSWRRVLRASVIAAVALEATDDALMMWYVPVGRLLSIAGAMLWMVALVAALRHALALARRIPDDDLVTQTRGVMCGLIVSYGLAALIAIAAITSSQLLTVIAMVFGLSCTVAVACLVFTLWSLGLLMRYTRALTEAANDAQMTWTQER